MKPLDILELFCGGGGAAMGYIQAGHKVTGVDTNANARTYYPGTFIHADAMRVITWRTIDRGFFLDNFDFIHASPPCQGWSTVTKRWINQNPRKYAKKYPNLIAPLRAFLQKSGKPYIIENVPGAPLEHPLKLCGLMFNLKLYRHRHFECSFPVAQPVHVKHDHQQPYSVYGNPRSSPKQNEVYAELVKSWPDQMGIYHIPPASRFFAEAIPPAFTKYIIEQYVAQVKSE